MSNRSERRAARPPRKAAQRAEAAAEERERLKRREANASWPLPALLTHVERRGWGDLAGKHFHGLRQVLAGLIACVDHRSGEGSATVQQVADAAGGYSRRWTAHLLKELEGLGAITWTRGGAVAGKPAPSHFRVNKQWLVTLVAGAMLMLAPLLEARRARTRARFERYGLNFTIPGRRRRRSGPGGTEVRPSPSSKNDPARDAGAGEPVPDWRALAAARDTGTGSGRREGESWRAWAARVAAA